jgi:DNA-binding NtrC family response regulator
MARVLLVDDEPDFVAAAIEILQMHGHEAQTAESLAKARESLARTVPDVLLLDLMLPDGNGLELLEELADSGLRRVVLITGHPGIKSLIKDLSGPSVSYLTKPIDGDDLLKLMKSIEDEDRTARGSAQKRHFSLIVGEHESMHALYEQIEKVARTDTPVLIAGETGTGKELVAESLHRASARSGDFVAVNCGSLSRDLAGSELFGHEKGSFTGAVRRHLGFFKRANQGTLFLDELTEMPLDLQPHFLRVLETGKVQPVGSEQESRVDTRIVSATNRDPEQAISEKILRQDLFFRLNVFPLLLPPLRNRASDIPLLVDHFLKGLQKDGADRQFSEAALTRLQAYKWPGNVRELRHVVQRAVIMAEPGAEIELPDRFDSPFGTKDKQGGLEAGRSIRDVERELIERTLSHFDGDKKAAADTLGISLNTLYNRLNAYDEGADRA